MPSPTPPPGPSLGLEHAPGPEPSTDRAPSAAEAGSERGGPREALVRGGARALGDAELVAILLGTGAQKEPVLRLSARLLALHGGLGALAGLGADELARTRGIGATKAARLLAAFELGRRVVHARPPPTHIRSAADVDRLLRPKLAELEVEHFLALALDARHRVLRELWIHKGTMTACQVSIADVFRAILREASPAVVFVHNHPSGDAEPSRDDVALTRQLVAAAKLLGVAVVDHVVVAREGYRSLRDEGLMSERLEREPPPLGAKGARG